MHCKSGGSSPHGINSRSFQNETFYNAFTYIETSIRRPAIFKFYSYAWLLRAAAAVYRGNSKQVNISHEPELCSEVITSVARFSGKQPCISHSSPIAFVCETDSQQCRIKGNMPLSLKHRQTNIFSRFQTAIKYTTNFEFSVASFLCDQYVMYTRMSVCETLGSVVGWMASQI
jgi:hypothetical protein